MDPDLKVAKVSTPAGNVDGAASRIVEMSDGSARVETWDARSRTWEPGGAYVDEVLKAIPVSPKMAARLGLPANVSWSYEV
jgi:hypothetical protein